MNASHSLRTSRFAREPWIAKRRILDQTTKTTKYILKNAIIELEPTSFPFEKFLVQVVVLEPKITKKLQEEARQLYICPVEKFRKSVF